MKRNYDAAIQAHYEQVAAADGASPASTMADQVTRRIETEAVLDLVADTIRLHRTSARSGERVSLCEVGCGNGYSLEQVARAFPDVICVGLEKTDALRRIASDRIAELKNPNVSVVPGDIRDSGFTQGRTFDIVLCQRVIINLLDLNDQKTALQNILAAVRPGGAALFIEAFESGLRILNTARAEFELPEIPTAVHNLYLPDDFFSTPELTPYESEGWRIPENALSTHYYVSRVLHPAILGARPFIRNSEFAKFLSAALPMGIGDYSQLRICAFKKRG